MQETTFEHMQGQKEVQINLYRHAEGSLENQTFRVQEGKHV